MEPAKTTGNGPTKPQHDAGGMAGSIGTSLQTLARKTSVADLRQKLDLSKRMNRNPYGTLALAVGAGYLLGGGFFSGTTRRLLGLGMKVGLRVGALALVRQQLSLMTEGAEGPGNSDHQPKQGAKT